MRQQARNYVFTINFADGEVTALLSVEFPEWLTYVVWQLELGHDNHVLHYQGYLECSGKKSMQQVHAVPGFERAALMVRAGTQGQAITYSTKFDTRIDGPWFHGEPKEQGKRSDLVSVKRAIDDGASDVTLWDSHFSSMTRYHKAFSTYKRVKAPKRDFVTRFLIVVGPSGCGKTTFAREFFKDAYWKLNSKWWDDYDGQEFVVWDEFQGQYPFRDLLRVLDGSPLSVESKGSHVNFCSRYICFTSNYHPKDWYDPFSINVSWEDSPLRRRLNDFGSVLALGPVPDHRIDLGGAGGISKFFRE
jgi:hypothetical protein